MPAAARRARPATLLRCREQEAFEVRMSVSSSMLVDVLVRSPWLMRGVTFTIAALLVMRVLFAVRPKSGQPKKKTTFGDRAWSSHG